MSRGTPISPHPRAGSQAPPVTVAVVDDVDIIAAGLRAAFNGRSSAHLVRFDDPAVERVDVALVDPFDDAGFDADAVARLLRDPRVGRVVVYTWALDRDRVSLALAAGAHGCLSKRLGLDRLRGALLRIAAGDRLVADLPGERTGSTSVQRAGTLDAVERLSARELEMVELIARGLSNQEIAARLYLSINSVKTYIRAAYRKLGVESRSQAILWAFGHGLSGGWDADRLHGAA